MRKIDLNKNDDITRNIHAGKARTLYLSYEYEEGYGCRLVIREMFPRERDLQDLLYEDQAVLYINREQAVELIDAMKQVVHSSSGVIRRKTWKNERYEVKISRDGRDGLKIEAFENRKPIGRVRTYKRYWNTEADGQLYGGLISTRKKLADEIARLEEDRKRIRAEIAAEKQRGEQKTGTVEEQKQANQIYISEEQKRIMRQIYGMKI